MTSKRKKLHKKIKDRLLVDAMHRCCLCPQHEDMTDIHHIVPINEKGPNTEENLMVVCPNCHAKIHRIRGRYTPEQLRMYKERWVSLCAKGLTLEECIAEEPGINLFIKPILQRGKRGKQGKAYPYLKALLDGLIEAAPNWMKAPAKFVSSLSEQLKDKGKEENRQLEQEITKISKDELREVIKEAGYEQKEDIELIVEKVQLIPDIFQTLNYRFDKVDEKLEEVKRLLQQERPVFSIGKQEIGRDSYQAGGDINIIKRLYEEKSIINELKSKIILEPNLIHITESEPNWVGRKGKLVELNKCYQDKNIHVVALIGWGGFGKTALARRWYELIKDHNIQPEGVFGWSFYKDKNLDSFLEASMNYVSRGDPEVSKLRTIPSRFAKIKEYLHNRKFLFILDGLEELQEDRQNDRFGCLKDTSIQGFIQNWADGQMKHSFCLITTRYPMTDLENWEGNTYKQIEIDKLEKEDGIELLKKQNIKGKDDELGRLVEEYGNHALSITLVAGFLKDFYSGFVKKATEIPFYKMKDEENKALRILKAYDERLTHNQRVFLQIFSCFIRKFEETDIKEVFRKEIKLRDGKIFNESLISMSKFEFTKMNQHLKKRRLIYENSMHPLIRNYFKSNLTEEERNAIKHTICLLSLHNQTPPEENFVGRKEMLDTITGWYKNPDVRIGGLIGWGGVGKSALVRKWYDELEANNIQPDGIFWWGFYRNIFLEQFLNALLRYVSDAQIEPDTIKNTWEKTERIKEYINQGSYLIILDGLEQMQKLESGDEFGKMIHRELTELLHYLAGVPKAGGMCLITTRFPLRNLDGWENHGYENMILFDLSIEDAQQMLKRRGVKGSDETMTEVIKKYKGHALSLTSLAGYLNRYYNGDINKAPDVEFVLGDEERFKDVNKLSRRYAEEMSDAERVFLNIFSLFRHDVTEMDFEGVFRKKIEGTRFNDVLVEMSELDFKDLIKDLVGWRLVSYDETKKTYATHPLIKTYFESDFSEKEKRLCHKRIYEYIGGYAPERADTLEEMQPLFEQVYHGCAAGLYDDLFENVYWEKIYRGRERLIIDKLGAWETELSLVRTFFPQGDLSQMPLVSKKSAQGFLLNAAGLALPSTGRPKEAEGPLLTGIKMYIEAEDWESASAGYQNLADLQFRTGELESGLASAKKVLDLAEKASFDWRILVSKAYLGWILYLLGRTEEAEKQFMEADELSMSTESSRLRTFAGVQYADFLISMWRIDEAFEITKQNLELCQRNNWINDISRCNRCLGAIERTKGNYKEAEDHLLKSFEIARKVGIVFLEIEALIENGRMCMDRGRYEGAIHDASEGARICERTGFKLYEPGAEVVLAKAYMGQKDFEQAEGFANSAYEKAVGMKYRWAEGDTADLLGEIYSCKGEKAKARKWLKMAVGCRKEILDPKVKESEAKLAGSG